MDRETFLVNFQNASGNLPLQACARASRLMEEHGAFIAAGLIQVDDIRPIQDHIRSLISLVSREIGKPLAGNPEEEFDSGFMALNRIDRAHGGLIYDACRRLMPVHALSSHSRLSELSKTLMRTDTLMCSNFKAVRIDHPSEDKYLFEWHQDYPYIQDSEDGVVYWIPLQSVDEKNGSVVIAPGSHKLGIQPVRVVDPENKNKNGAATMTLADRSVVDRFPHIPLPVREGEVLVFNELLLHRSSPNRSQRARWTLQVRHGNFESSAAVQRRWPGGIIDGVGFAERHPDKVAKKTNLPV